MNTRSFAPEPGAQDDKTTVADAGLARELTLPAATAVNIIDMIGVGPFITMPLIITAMGGPQAMLGWIFGAIFALCDGLVWAELGAAMPRSGGSYEYLKQLYGPRRLGRLASFLFVWQLSFSAPLSIASGCIGLAQYAAYFSPALDHFTIAREVRGAVPGLGTLTMHVALGPATLVAIGACVLAAILLYRPIRGVGRLSRLLSGVVLATMAWVIFAGLTHFSAARAFDFPAGAFHLDGNFFTGLGAAMLVATYDYWGYYNVCFLGGEVREPARNIPRAVMYSIGIVAALYVVMNISILGVVPWREMQRAAAGGTHMYVISTFMQSVYGAGAARVVTALVMLTGFASVFSLLLGYSRVPYAAALDRNYFRVFSKVHPRYKFPATSLVALAAAACIFCFFRLADVIAALVVIRIVIQFLVQAIGLLWWRARHPEAPRPFRMWLYPLPAVVAIAGFVFVLWKRPNFMNEISLAIVVVVVGSLVYFLRAAAKREWPFGSAAVTAD